MFLGKKKNVTENLKIGWATDNTSTRPNNPPIKLYYYNSVINIIYYSSQYNDIIIQLNTLLF